MPTYKLYLRLNFSCYFYYQTTETALIYLRWCGELCKIATRTQSHKCNLETIYTKKAKQKTTQHLALKAYRVRKISEKILQAIYKQKTKFSFRFSCVSTYDFNGKTNMNCWSFQLVLYILCVFLWLLFSFELHFWHFGKY